MSSSQRDPLGVIVLGMHRSGTSLTVNLLSAAGAYVESSIPPDDRNPRGFGESREVVDLNRRIMALLGITTSWIPPLDPGWPRASRLDRYRGWAQRILSRLDSHPVWVLKDPRFSLTLPFWLPLIDRPVRCVVCIRNPLESAISTGRSRSVTPRDLSTWYEFTVHALRNTTDRSRLIVHFERYFDSQGLSQVGQLCAFLGLEVPADVRSVISPALYRNRVPLQTLRRDEQVPERIKILYERLLDSRGSDTEKLDYGRDEFDPGPQGLGRSLRTLLVRATGWAWVVYRDNPIYARLPDPIRRALGRATGEWSR